MPEYTTNLNLPKPLGNENVSRANHNALVDAVDANAAPKVHTHIANEINAGTLDSARLPDASLSAKGAVQLEDSLTSTSTTKAATPSAVKAVNDAVSAHLADTTPHGTIQGVNKFGYGNGGDLTISSGAITVTGSFHLIDTEGAASTDDLVTINGGAQLDFLILQLSNVNRKVTIKNQAGNIYTFDASDIVLGNNYSSVMLIKRNATDWAALPVGLKRSGDTMTGPLVVRTNTRLIDLRSTEASAGMVPITIRRDATEYWWVNLNGNNDFNIVRQSGTGHFKVNDVAITQGAGSPEGVVAAVVSSIYQRTDGGASTTLYVKESGTGNTGWKAVTTA